MDKNNSCSSPSEQYFSVFKRYVLSPLNTAVDTVEQECRELEVERDTYERFGTRVARLDTRASNYGSSAMMDGGNRDGMATIRTTCRETVMAMSHYDDVYDNTLIADIGGEFGEDVAAAIRPDTGFVCTDEFRGFLSSADVKRASDRDAVVDSLADEKASLTTIRSELTEAIATADDARIPRWYTDEFVDRLDELAAERQESIRNQRLPGWLDGHYSTSTSMTIQSGHVPPSLRLVGSVRLSCCDPVQEDSARWRQHAAY